MDKYQKLAVSISSLALLVSLAVPALNYFIFNPMENELRYSGHLVVEESFQLSDDGKKIYRVGLKNTGKRTISGIEIGAMTMDRNIVIPTKRTQILTIPIRDFELKTEDHRVFIKLTGSLAQGEEAQVYLKDLLFPEGSTTSDFRVDVGCNSGNGTRVSISRGVGADD